MKVQVEFDVDDEDIDFIKKGAELFESFTVPHQKNFILSDDRKLLLLALVGLAQTFLRATQAPAPAAGESPLSPGS